MKDSPILRRVLANCQTFPSLNVLELSIRQMLPLLGRCRDTIPQVNRSSVHIALLIDVQALSFNAELALIEGDPLRFDGL